MDSIHGPWKFTDSQIDSMHDVDDDDEEEEEEEEEEEDDDDE